MSFREKMKDANVVMRLGMALLIVAMLANRFLHPTPQLSENAVDGAKGLFYGLAIGMLLLSIRLRGKKCPSQTA